MLWSLNAALIVCRLLAVSVIVVLTGALSRWLAGSSSLLSGAAEEVRVNARSSDRPTPDCVGARGLETLACMGDASAASQVPRPSADTACPV
jgi:hypothetical protein